MGQFLEGAMLIETIAIVLATAFVLVALFGHGLLFKALLTRHQSDAA